MTTRLEHLRQSSKILKVMEEEFRKLVLQTPHGPYRVTSAACCNGEFTIKFYGDKSCQYITVFASSTDQRSYFSKDFGGNMTAVIETLDIIRNGVNAVFTAPALVEQPALVEGGLVT